MVRILFLFEMKKKNWQILFLDVDMKWIKSWINEGRIELDFIGNDNFYKIKLNFTGNDKFSGFLDLDSFTLKEMTYFIFPH